MIKTLQDVAKHNAKITSTVPPVHKNGVDGYWYECICLNKYGQHPEVFNYPEIQSHCKVCGAKLNWEGEK